MRRSAVFLTFGVLLVGGALVGGGARAASRPLVPNVLALPQAAARMKIESLGLRVCVISGIWPTVSVGKVFREHPAVGTPVRRGAQVTIWVALPHWLSGVETLALDKVFGGAKPIRTDYISYPRKIAVIFEFKRVVICRTCSGPSAAAVPRGRVIRVSFDRQTHRLNGPMHFCEARGSLPPRALCLRR